MDYLISLCTTALTLSLSFIFTCLIGLILIRISGGNVHIVIADDEADKDLRKMIDDEGDD